MNIQIVGNSNIDVNNNYIHMLYYCCLNNIEFKNNRRLKKTQYCDTTKNVYL